MALARPFMQDVARVLASLCSKNGHGRVRQTMPAGRGRRLGPGDFSRLARPPGQAFVPGWHTLFRLRRSPAAVSAREWTAAGGFGFRFAFWGADGPPPPAW